MKVPPIVAGDPDLAVAVGLSAARARAKICRPDLACGLCLTCLSLLLLNMGEKQLTGTQNVVGLKYDF